MHILEWIDGKGRGRRNEFNKLFDALAKKAELESDFDVLHYFLE